MTAKEKAEKISLLEIRLATMEQELEKLRAEKTDEEEFNFSKWYNDIKPSDATKFLECSYNSFLLKQGKDRICYLYRLLKFKYCFDKDFEPDWSSDKEKYTVGFSHFNNRFEATKCYGFETTPIFFSSFEIAQKFCDWANLGFPV